MTIKLGKVKYEFEFSTGVWTDITNRVIQTVSGKMGIHGNSLFDRIADVGTMKLILRNVNNEFTPGHINCREGFMLGVRFRFQVANSSGNYKTRFYGYVPKDGITLDSNKYLSITSVTIVDYIERLSSHKINFPTHATNKRINEVANLILANMNIQPLSTDFSTGESVFTSVFDTVKPHTIAMQELSKLVISELGFLYLKQTDTSDEVLCIDSRYKRSGESVEAIFDNSFMDSSESYVKHYYNKVSAIVYPRRIDETNVILYILQTPIYVPDGETVNITGRFVDPDQEAVSVAGIDMIQPVSSTDFKAYENADETGADLTANFTVTATYGTNGAEFEIINTGAAAGYVTKLQARGHGVYTYRPTEYTVEKSSEITALGESGVIVKMPYQDNPLSAQSFAKNLLELFYAKRMLIDEISVAANRSAELTDNFINLQVGSRIRIIDNISGHDADYYIQSIEFTINPPSIIFYKYGLLPASMLPASGYWKLGDASYSQLGETTILGW